MADQEILELGRELGLDGSDLQNFLRDERRSRREEMQFELELQAQRAQIKKEEDERKLLIIQEQLKLAEIKATNDQAEVASVDEGATRTHHFHKLMPPFDETKDDMDAYLLRFERLAKARKWHEVDWAPAHKKISTPYMEFRW